MLIAMILMIKMSSPAKSISLNEFNIIKVFFDPKYLLIEFYCQVDPTWILLYFFIKVGHLIT